jgi:hypothetical protein
MAELRKSPSEIRALIQSRLAAGMLPDVRVEKVWAGKGTGRPCYGCDEPISPAEVEAEIDLAGAVALRFHQSCLRFWQEEMDKVTQDDQGTPLP